MATQLPSPKYRPVLTGEQISHILHLCKSDSSRASMSVIATLAPFEFKILNGAINPAYTPEAKQSTMEALGFEIVENPNIPDGKIAVHGANLSAEHAGEALYQIWLTQPHTLNAKQLAIVRAWRYENNKMTDDENKLFEKEVLGFE